MTQQNDGNIYLNGFTGINNKINPQNLKNNELVDAVNVDITDAGNIKSRPLWKYVLDGYTDAHSLYANNQFMFFVNEDNLIKVDKNLKTEIIDTGYKGLITKFTNYNNQVIISNDSFIKRYKKGKIYNLIPESYKNGFHYTIETNGTFPIGTYKVAITLIHDDGLEGATVTPVEIKITQDNSKITLTNLDQNILDINIVKYRVYLSRTNGSELFRFDDFDISNDSIELFYNINTMGQRLDTINMYPLNNGKFITKYNGYLLTASDNFVYISKPLSLLTESDYWEFEGNITMLIAMESAQNSCIYVSDEYNVYCLSGDIENIVRQKLDCLPAIPYSDCKSPITNEMFFFTQRGQMLGDSSGTIKNLTEERFLPDVDLVSGASIVVLSDGRKKIISSFVKGNSNSMGFGDWAKIVD